MGTSTRHPRQGLALAVLGLALSLGAHLALSQTPHVCFEKVSDVAAIYLQEHPAGGKLTVATQDGLIRLMTLPPVGSGQLAADVSTFLDLTSRVRFKGEQGLLSFAFHPQFLRNGRFFVSYVCDARRHRGCQGTCAIASMHNRYSNAPLCPFNTIVAEYSAGADPTNATAVEPTEVRQILKFGRPYENHNGGHIWFGVDGHLYYASGDGGNQRDPLSTSQNGLMPLGKILRLDVDAAPTETQWGSYSVPKDNPFVGNGSGVMPEVYALGFRNPWRCSVDPKTGLTLCGDVGQDAVEEVDVVLKGHNYGWSFFEALDVLKPNAPEIPVSGKFTPPTFAYCHREWEDEEDEDAGRGLAVIGGHVYRAKRNTCLQGKYIFGDEFGVLFLGSLFPPNSTVPYTNATYQNVSYSIAPTSTSSASLKLEESATGFPANDMLFSWGTDRSQELYRLSSSGVFRVTDASSCGHKCSALEEVVGLNGTAPGDIAWCEVCGGFRTVVRMWMLALLGLMLLLI